MNREKLEKLLREGEGYTVEFKSCHNALNDGVFETVCSFSNRYGGYILLGVKEENGKGVVYGVNPSAVESMKKNFVNMLNNPQMIHPSLYLTLEEFEYDGKIVLWVYVPVTSQIQFCNRKIFDRNNDADQDVSVSSDLVSNISNRKSANYLERRIFPYATMDDLCMEMMPKIRQLAINRYPRHVWKELNDLDVLKSAGLYEKDFATGKEGFNMAAILLLGKKETIRSCVPGYRTDAICRIRDRDRYDDRLIVEENLLKSYDLLISFIEKHTNDKFCLKNGQSVSARTIIAREMVSNILVHRDFSSAFPARIIIERDKMFTENWNRTQRIGKIDLSNFAPYPKNPIIANFFVNIGYADSLGSGVRNLYEYSNLYSGTDPLIEEGEVFKISVLIPEDGIPAQKTEGPAQKTGIPPKNLGDSPLKNTPQKSGDTARNLGDTSQTSCDTPQKSANTPQKTADTPQKTADTPQKPEDTFKFNGVKLSLRQNDVMKLIMDNPLITFKIIGEALGISRMTARDVVDALVKKGILQHIGSQKGGRWQIIQKDKAGE